MNEWIDVNDRLPDYDIQVLWVRESGFMFCAELDHDMDRMAIDKFLLTCSDISGKTTHWMPLPEAPC